MLYKLVITPESWLTPEQNKPITKITGFKYLEELLLHPNQTIQIQRLFFILEYSNIRNNKNSVSKDTKADYITRCYDLAREEQIQNAELLSKLRAYKRQIINDTSRFNDIEMDQIANTEAFLRKWSHQEPNIDKLVMQTYHQVYTSIKRAIQKLEKFCPILAMHIKKTIKLKACLAYKPEMDDDIDLFIKDSR